MARPSTGANLNIAQLEEILDQRRSTIGKLEKQKADLQKKIDALDREIEKVGGSTRIFRTATGAPATKKVCLRPWKRCCVPTEGP